jgi:hypothetical protein
MGLKERLWHLAGRLYFERPAHRYTVAEHAERLRRSGEKLAARLAAAAGTPKHREKLRHVVAIERWGQRRLKVFVGEPFVLDRHHPYTPPDAGWEQLRRDFDATRAETVALAERLSSPEPATHVRHNQFGELSARGWLRYITGHAHVELRKLK